MFHKKGLSDIDLKDKRVLMRADYNVPMKDGSIEDDYRIKQSIDTIKALLEQRCRVVLMSHLGRPKGVEESLSLRPVAERLSELLEQDVQFIDECVGDAVRKKVFALEAGQILLLENLRFHYEEEVDDEQFAAQLAEFGDVFVQDAFGVVHRAHASTHAITKHLPSVAGLLLENEVRQITRAIKHPKKPMVAVVGGAKIKTKIELLDNLLSIGVDRLIIGGAMANTFLVALDMSIGKSLYDEGEIETAQRVIAECRDKDILLLLPLIDSAVTKEISDDAERIIVNTEDISDDDIILDFGDKSTESVLENLKDAGTVVWNGPLGMMEIDAFRVGSQKVADFIVENKIDSVVGGGDTVELIVQLGLIDGFTHVSTGGGASLELMSGSKLPGIEALEDK